MNKTISIFAIVAYVAICFTTVADDWPIWRGPDRNGISKETGWNPLALSPQPKIKWSINVGAGHSSVAVKGDLLYTMGNVDDKDIIYCLKVSDGSEVWRHAYSCKKGNYDGPRSTPVLDGKNVYTHSRDGKLFCLDAVKGNVVWKKDLMAEHGIKKLRWGYATSCVIEDDLLLLNVGSTGMAFNKKTGAKIWGAAGATEPGYASPVIFDQGGKKSAAIFGAKGVNIVDVKSGKLLKSFAWKTSYDVHAADPLYSDSNLYISSGYGTGGALLDIKGSAPKVIWQNKSMRNHFSSSVLLDGNLYGIDDNTGKGNVKCMDFKTGVEKWAQGGGYEGLMIADGKLIIMDKKGILTIAEAAPAGLKVISSGQVLTDKGVKNWTTPVLANKSIYCRNAIGSLVCVDVSK